MKLKNIVIDQGNSFAKAGFFIGDELQEERGFADESDLSRWVEECRPECLLLSSVVGDGLDSLQVKIGSSRFIRLTVQTLLPFENLYKTPQTLGPDRLAAVAGAQFLAKNSDCLVIDLGTCITYDFINANGQYKGGGISPGLQMRFKALNNFTSKLPLIERRDEFDLIGNSTESSILSGVLHGAVSEVDGIIHKYRGKYKDLKVFICGGDTKFFESKLKEHIFAVANLVLIGLNKILLLNVEDFEADI